MSNAGRFCCRLRACTDVTVGEKSWEWRVAAWEGVQVMDDVARVQMDSRSKQCSTVSAKWGSWQELSRPSARSILRQPVAGTVVERVVPV
jgi:hypothetical protein